MRIPRLTVDGVIIGQGQLVLIQRAREPFKGCWALPGGFVEYGERVEAGVVREVREETGLDTQVNDLLGVYSDPRRDPRGHTISVVFLLETVGGILRGGDDAARAQWFPLHELPKLAFDHSIIVHDALRHLHI